MSASSSSSSSSSPPPESTEPAQIVLAVDVGSSSIRCTAFRILDNDDDESEMPTVQGIEGCSASIKLQAVQPNTGKINVYLDDNNKTGCDDTIMDAIDDRVDETLVKIRAKYPIEGEGKSFVVSGVAFSTFVMNLVGVDSMGWPVGNEATISYACNATEVANECAALRSELGEGQLKRMYRRTGAPLHSAYALPQLRAFYASNPELAANVDRWTSLATLCVNRWTGGLVCRYGFPISYSEASWTGMLNFRTGKWDEEVTDLLPGACSSALPNVRDDIDFEPYSDRWPELRGHDVDSPGHVCDETCRKCRLFLGIGDGACANIGSKCTGSNRIAVTVGTSAAARIVLPLPIVDASIGGDMATAAADIAIPSGLFCYRINRQHILVGGALTDGGSVVEWLRSVFKLESDDAFQEAMARIKNQYDNDHDSNTSTLAAVPFLSGERSTGYRSGASGVLSGITRETTSDDIIRSCLEGVILRIYAVLSLIMDSRQSLSKAVAAPCILASGNGLVNNTLWMQMLADCSDLDVVVDGETSEATSRGAALLAALALRPANGSRDLGEEELQISARTIPIEVFSSVWVSKVASQDSLIGAVSPLWE